MSKYIFMVRKDSIANENQSMLSLTNFIQKEPIQTEIAHENRY